MRKFSIILDEIKQYLEVKTDTEVSRALGVNRGTLGSWKAREFIPYEELLRFCEKHGVSFSRLLEGDRGALDEDILSLASGLQALKGLNKTQFGHIEGTVKMFLKNFK